METKKPRGFAAMDRDRVREIATKGGKAAHAKGVAHQFTSEEAREAGRKGGIAPHARRGRGAPRLPAPDPRQMSIDDALPDTKPATAHINAEGGSA